MIRLLGIDELGNTFCIINNCKILEMDDLSREEKSTYASILIDRYRKQYQEARGFYFEKVASYVDEESVWEYFYDMALDDAESDDEAFEMADKMLEEFLEKHYGLGFDY